MMSEAWPDGSAAAAPCEYGLAARIGELLEQWHRQRAADNAAAAAAAELEQDKQA